MSTIFRTSELTSSNRFGYWRALMCRNFVNAHGSTPDRDGFDARFTVCPLGSATLFGMAAPSQSWDRNPGHIRRSPSDDFLLTLLVSGDGVLRQDGREVIQRPGTMLLYDTSLPYTYELSGETLAMKIPRRALLSRVSRPVRPAEPISSESGMGALAASVLKQALRLDIDPAASPASLVGSSLLDIVAALLDSAPADHRRPEQMHDASLFARVRRHALGKLGDSSLSVTSMARAHGVSTRTLNRAFAVAGTTPMRWIWQQRLELGRRTLTEDPRRRVTDVALDCGFRDLSHFSRAFKHGFGESPVSLSGRARSGRSIG